MREIPVYQMCLNPNYNESLGLIFTSELNDFKDFYSQPLLFTIPLFQRLINMDDLKEYLKNYIPVFQVEIDNKIHFLKGEFYNHYLHFNIPFMVNKTINFGVQLDSINTNVFFKYAGHFSNKIKPNYGFLIIYPTDVGFLNNLYSSYNTILIGLTPAYKEINNFL